MAAIREDFRRSLPVRAQQLRTQWGNVARCRSPAAIAGLLRQVHTLKGSAATFDFDVITLHADGLMRILRPLSAQQRLPDARETVRIEVLLEQIESHARG